MTVIDARALDRAIRRTLVIAACVLALNLLDYGLLWMVVLALWLTAISIAGTNPLPDQPPRLHPGGATQPS